MKTRIIATLIVCLSITWHANAKSVVGFWLVSKVTVGAQDKTPVSRWFKINKDGTCTGGNGWTQNSIGTWSYDKKKKEFNPTDDLGIREGFEAFKVHFVKDTMKWVRQEYGKTVVVSLIPIEEMPPAPADLVKGLWLLKRAENSEGIELADYDPNGRQYIFIRADNVFRLRKPDESVTNGFWQMGHHEPMLTLINRNGKAQHQEFNVAIEHDTLTMKSKNEEGITYHYSRIREFPE